MTKYIKRKDAIRCFKASMAKDAYPEVLKDRIANAVLSGAESIDIVHCKDCKWYEPPHILFNNGTKTYFDSEENIEYVTADIGSNVGGQCIGHKTYCTAHDREDPEDYPEIVVFRDTNDYCSYGEKKDDKD